MQVSIFLIKNGSKNPVNIADLSRLFITYQVFFYLTKGNSLSMLFIRSLKSRYLESLNSNLGKSMMITKSKISSLKPINSTKKNFINLSLIPSTKINLVKSSITNSISFPQHKVLNDFFLSIHALIIELY